MAIALLAVLALAVPARAWAAVEIAFYSRELGSSFPHAFVTLKGTLDRTGEPIDQSFGFTAKAVTPAVLMGSVGGKVITESADYIARSDRQFALTIDDARYDAVMRVVATWRDRAQPSYDLNRRNCVHFVGELAQAAGLAVDFQQQLMKKPRSFLIAVREDNRSMLDRAAELAPATR